MNTVKKTINSIGSFLLHYIDFILFIILITVKLFLFADLSGTVFVKQGLTGYLYELLNWFTEFEPSSLTELRQGIVMVSLGAVLLASFWVLLLPRKSRLIAFLSLDLILSFIIFADMVYFRYFEDLISTNVLLQAGQVGALEDSIFNLFSTVDWLFFIDLLILIPLVIFLIQKISTVKTTKKKLLTRIVSSLMVFIVGYTLVFYPIKVFIDKGGSYLFDKTLSNMRVYEKTGLLGFHGFDIYKYVNENILQNNQLTGDEKASIKKWFNDHQSLMNNNSDFTGAAKGANVIVLQLEAFENYLINKTIEGQEITPNLNKLKEKSLYFNNFYHQTASGRTSDAEFLVNTSFYPMYTGSAYISYSSNTFDALPKTLKENGYSTAAFHAYKKSFWNRYLMYPSLGIDTFYSLDSFEKKEPLGWSISDESMLKQSADKMDDLKQPFHSMLVTLTSHHPYHLPEKYQKLEINHLKNKTLIDYLQSAHYVDQAVGTFIEELKNKGLWKNSLVVIYGDHDSALLQEKGEVAEFVGVANDQLGYEQNKREVPLLIHLPEQKDEEVYEKVGGQIDIGPTILDLLGIKPQNQYMMGLSLFKEQDNLVVFRDGSFTTNELFYSSSIDGVFENGTCYDTTTGEETELNACQPYYEDALKRLRISDDVLQADLLDDWLKKNKE